jgi:Holliday junction resolvase RusA-like endonuclease
LSTDGGVSVKKCFVIEGNPVSGKNHMEIRFNPKTKSRFIAIGKAARTWQDEAVRQLVEQRKGSNRSTLRGQLYIEYRVYQSADTRDIDNIEAALFDALKKAKVIEDDKNIVDHRGAKFLSDQPRIEIELLEIAA